MSKHIHVHIHRSTKDARTKAQVKEELDKVNAQLLRKQNAALGRGDRVEANDPLMVKSRALEAELKTATTDGKTEELLRKYESERDALAQKIEKMEDQGVTVSPMLRKDLEKLNTQIKGLQATKG